MLCNCRKYIIDIMTHRFPNPRLHKARLLDWIRLVGLSNMNSEIVYNKNEFVTLIFQMTVLVMVQRGLMLMLILPYLCLVSYLSW